MEDLIRDPRDVGSAAVTAAWATDGAASRTAHATPASASVLTLLLMRPFEQTAGAACDTASGVGEAAVMRLGRSRDIWTRVRVVHDGTGDRPTARFLTPGIPVFDRTRIDEGMERGASIFF